jgi:hypothetical protein
LAFQYGIEKPLGSSANNHLSTGGINIPHPLFDRRNRFSQVDITMERKYYGMGDAVFAKARSKAHAAIPVLQSPAGEGIRDFIFPADREFGPPMND